MTSTKDSTTSPKYKCNICKDDGWVKVGDNTYQRCECLDLYEIEDIKKRCGISQQFLSKSLDNYKTTTAEQTKLKNMAADYLKQVTKDNIPSIGYFGQSGVGKSHLTIAIANELMNRNIPVFYMPYAERIAELKNLNRDLDTLEDYKRLMNRLKNVKVLLIDDLFKGARDKENKINPTDLRIIFEILNYRVLNGKAVIISSEYLPNQIVQYIDEAVGGRIIEMCGKYISISKRDSANNYRLKAI